MKRGKYLIGIAIVSVFLMAAPPMSIAAPADPADLWAVVILGTGNEEELDNEVRHIYTTLTKKYGFKEDHIYVLYYDYVGVDVDCDGKNEKVQPATLKNVRTVYGNLQKNLTGHDLLFTFISSHGKSTGKGALNDFTDGNSYVEMQSGPDLTDVELNRLTRRIKAGCKIFVIGACYSGGFINDLKGQKNVVISTSCRDNECFPPITIGGGIGTFDPYLYHYTNALRKAQPAGGGLGICTDGAAVAPPNPNGNGRVEIKEAHDHADRTMAKPPNPQYEDNPATIGATNVWLGGCCMPDFGDAPDPFKSNPPGRYPSLLKNNGARHLDFRHEWLGNSVDGEKDSQQVDKDRFDDGVKTNLDFNKGTGVVKFTVSTSGLGAKRYVKGDKTKQIHVHGWFDWNGNGAWEAGELVVDWSGGPGITAGWPATAQSKEIVVNIKVPKDTADEFFVRFRLDYGEDKKTPTGSAKYGEVEDHNFANTSVEKTVWTGEDWMESVNAKVCDTVKFKLWIHNSGICNLTNITVTDTLPDSLELSNRTMEIHPNETDFKLTSNPDGTTTLRWFFNDTVLKPCENITIIFWANVIKCGIDINVVNATGYACNETWVSDEDDASVNVPVPVPGLTPPGLLILAVILLFLLVHFTIRKNVK